MHCSGRFGYDLVARDSLGSESVIHGAILSLFLTSILRLASLPYLALNVRRRQLHEVATDPALEIHSIASHVKYKTEKISVNSVCFLLSVHGSMLEKSGNNLHSRLK